MKNPLACYGRNRITVNHIDGRRLFDSARGRINFTPQERRHIHECEECATLLGVFARESIFTPGIKPRDFHGMKRLKVLIVDDDRAVISLLMKWLSVLGHHVIGISGGRNIEKWARKEECDLVFLDLGRPDADGLSLISNLVKTTHAKVIANLIMLSQSSPRNYAGNMRSVFTCPLT